MTCFAKATYQGTVKINGANMAVTQYQLQDDIDIKLT